MDTGFHVSTLFIAIVVLALLSAFFSGSETAMMALNRYRLRHLVKQGHRGARKASELLRRAKGKRLTYHQANGANV